jgi:chitinase
MYVGAGDHFKLTHCDDDCGLKYYTLAFIIARQEGSGKQIHYFPQPAWDGHTPMGENFYKDQIDAIRNRGGDVIVSFGGEAGRELAIIETDPTKLLALYQQILGRYHFTWLDFDIEGSNLEKNPQANQRRNTVLAELQKQNPGLRITYTVPVDPNGISSASRDLLTDAAAKGLKVYSANLMVMFFGPQFIHKEKTEGELGIESANKAYEQIQKIDPTIRIGLCPALGENGSDKEVFTPQDAKTLKIFADQTPWICSLHFWSINDDAGKKPNTTPWEFAKIFVPFITH